MNTDTGWYPTEMMRVVATDSATMKFKVVKKSAIRWEGEALIEMMPRKSGKIKSVEAVGRTAEELQHTLVALAQAEEKKK